MNKAMYDAMYDVVPGVSITRKSPVNISIRRIMQHGRWMDRYFYKLAGSDNLVMHEPSGCPNLDGATKIVTQAQMEAIIADDERREALYTKRGDFS